MTSQAWLIPPGSPAGCTGTMTPSESAETAPCHLHLRANLVRSGPRARHRGREAILRDLTVVLALAVIIAMAVLSGPAGHRFRAAVSGRGGPGDRRLHGIRPGAGGSGAAIAGAGSGATGPIRGPALPGARAGADGLVPGARRGCLGIPGSPRHQRADHRRPGGRARLPGCQQRLAGQHRDRPGDPWHRGIGPHLPRRRPCP